MVSGGLDVFPRVSLWNDSPGAHKTSSFSCCFPYTPVDVTKLYSVRVIGIHKKDLLMKIYNTLLTHETQRDLNGSQQSRELFKFYYTRETYNVKR